MILDEIAARTLLRVEENKQKVPLPKIRAAAEAMGNQTGFPFEKALAAPGLSFICEVKKASPSKGLIAPEFPYVKIAKEYEEAGAAAISCLTEPYYFLGRDDYLREISRAVRIPILRKDFTVDSYMLYEAKCMGASAVLLICALLSADTLQAYIRVAHSLGLSVLVEVHTEQEADTALQAGARIIGVNNRDLKTFKVDIQTCIRLRRIIPREILYVAESGIQNAQDIRMLRENAVDAVLIGETLMRQRDKKAALARLRGDLP